MVFEVMPFFVNVIEGGQLQLMLPCQIPFVDPATRLGYIVTSVFHSYIIFLAFAGTTGTDLTITIIILNGISMSEIFDHAFKELDKLAVARDTDNHVIKLKLRNIVQMHIETCE